MGELFAISDSEGVLLPETRPPTNLNLNLNYEKLHGKKLQNLCHADGVSLSKLCEV